MSTRESSNAGDRLTALLSAIFAVLAALGTLFAHHRSIAALALKNDAILTTAKSSDLYSAYQTKRVRVALYSTLLSADVIAKPSARAQADGELKSDRSASLATLEQARALEARAASEQQRAERLLGSYETLELATTLFEIAIVFSSIAALSSQRVMLWSGVAISAIGMVLGLIGFLQAH